MFNHQEHLYNLERPRLLKFKNKEDLKQIEIKETKLNKIGFKVFAFYILSPYTILSCVGQSTGVFSNFLIVLSLLFATLNQRFLSSFFISLLSFNSFHSIILILPIALIIELKRNFKCKNCKFDEFNFEFKLKSNNDNLVDENIDGNKKIIKNIVFSIYSILGTCLICFTFICIFIFISYLLMNQNLEFINSTFLFM